MTKPFNAMFSKLKKGGFLLLTTPNFYYKSITDSDNGPFSKFEDGWHVRRGYSKEMLRELCIKSGFMVEEISYCSGFFSQKVTFLLRILNGILGVRISWFITFPLRIFPIIFDNILSKIKYKIIQFVLLHINQDFNILSKVPLNFSQYFL